MFRIATMRPGKLCPSCGAFCQGSCAKCQCGHGFFAPIAPPQVQRAPASPVAAPVVVQIHQPTNFKGPTCPRCTSPYINPTGEPRRRVADEVSILCLIVGIGAGLFFWPFFALLLYAVPRRTETALNCHNCGMNFKVSSFEPFTKAQAWCAAVSAMILFVPWLVYTLTNYRESHGYNQQTAAARATAAVRNVSDSGVNWP